MVYRYSFIPVFSVLLSGLAWWSNLESPTHPSRASACSSSTLCGESQTGNEWIRRKKLIESLDHLVASQHQYRNTHGGFTQFLNRTGFSLPQNLANAYDLKVAEASEKRLLIQAFSKERLPNENVLDWVSIDQDFKVHANFELSPVSRMPAAMTNQKGLEIELIDDEPHKIDAK